MKNQTKQLHWSDAETLWFSHKGHTSCCEFIYRAVNVTDAVCYFIWCFPADINEERGCNPQHLTHLSLRYAEARVDYMGTCILMGNLSAFKTDLRDEWTLQETTSPSTGKLFSLPVLCVVFSQTDSANDLLPRSSDNFMILLRSYSCSFCKYSHAINCVWQIAQLVPPKWTITRSELVATRMWTG